MTGIYCRYIKLPKKDDRDVYQPKIGHNKNQFVSLCTSKDCREFIYMGEEIARTKGLCLKHYNQFIEKRFKSITTIKRRKICKLCGQAIKNKRNKLYCSVTCRQKASRKIPSLSIEKLVQSPEWRRVDRLIRTSPLGLNSINHKDHLDDLCFLFILCHLELKSKQNHEIFAFYHVIPLRLGGNNKLDNIIIAPSFIKRSINLSQFETFDYPTSKKPFYIEHNIIDTCLKNKNLKNKMLKLIEKLNLLFNFHKNKKLKEDEILLIKEELNFYHVMKERFSYTINKYHPDSLFVHLEKQLRQLRHLQNYYQQLEPMINFYHSDEIKSDISFRPIKDFFDLFALHYYIKILNGESPNFRPVRYDIDNELYSSHFYWETNNKKLLKYIMSNLKFKLTKKEPINKHQHYNFIKVLYERYFSK